MISFDRVSKSFGTQKVLAEFDLNVSPGRITAIVGPNGSGKSTLLRGLLGLIPFNSGEATLDSKPYRELVYPMRTVGAHLGSNLGSPTRKARQFLRILAISQGLPSARVSEVLNLVGLEGVAHKRIGKLSLGMRQRLGIAMALLGDPKYLIFDEPLNGLDQDGIIWFRNLLAKLASSGKGIIIASHILSEVERIAHEVVFIGRGYKLGHMQMDEMRKLNGLLTAVDASRYQELINAESEKLVPVGELRLIHSDYLDFWINHEAVRTEESIQVQLVGDVMETIYKGILSNQVDYVGKGDS